MTAYDKVLAARSKGRLTGRNFIDGVFDSFFELHGDKRFADDNAVVCGVGTLLGRPVTVIAHEKGAEVADKVKRNFGSAHPEGYRKALRQMLLAQKFNRPILTFVDTAGAFCGVGAEERGQGLAIAENLAYMSDLTVPIISVFIGDGGSGGALGIAVADEVWILENAVYSVISPEGCASILFKNPKRAAEAAESLKLTSADILAFGVADRVIAETEDRPQMFEDLRKDLDAAFGRLANLSKEELTANRYLRFRKFGGSD